MKPPLPRVKLLTLLLVAVAALFVLSAGASAATIDCIAVDGCPTQSADDTVDRVYWWYNSADGAYYLFLPSCADPNSLTVYVQSDADVFVDSADTPLRSGDKLSVFSACGTYTLSCGADDYTLYVRKTSLPAVFITTESGSSDYIHANKENRESGQLLIVNGEKTEYDGDLKQIKGRGNSTWYYPKKPYNIKLDSKENLFGMGKSKNWCLLANYADPTLLRNLFVVDLTERIGLPYTGGQTAVNLWLNGAFQGAYAITEKVEVGDNRVEINDLTDATEKANDTDDLEAYPRGGAIDTTDPGDMKWVDIPENPADITGGYLLEVDIPSRYKAELSGFVTDRGFCVVVKEPECASQAQVAYIRAYYQAFEDALYSETGYNAQGIHYSAYCDMDSLVKAYIINDYSVNYDTGVSSCFFYKDSGETMFAGPLWDYDNSFGNHYDNRFAYSRGYNLKDPRNNYVREGKNDDYPLLFGALYDHEDFAAAVYLCWTRYMASNGEGIDEWMTRARAATENDALLNALRWNLFSSAAMSDVQAGYVLWANQLDDYRTARRDYLNAYYAPTPSTDLRELVRFVEEEGFVFVQGKTIVAQLLAAAPPDAVVRSQTGDPLGAGTALCNGMRLFSGDKAYTVYIPGDVDSDGIVSAADARLVLRASVGLDSLDETQRFLALVPAGGSPSADHARTVLRIAVRLDNPILMAATGQ